MALLLSLASPVMANAQEAPRPNASEQATTHFRRGVELYDEADFATALVEFRRAYQTVPDFRVLYNIAQAEYQLQRYANALLSFRKYLSDGGANVPAPRRAEVEREIGKLEGRVARVTIVAEGAGDVFVDDELVGHTPLREPLVISAGQHRVRVVRGDAPPFAKRVELAGGDDISLVVDAEARARPPNASPRPDAEPRTAEPKGIDMRVVAWSATGALTVGAVAVGVMALSAEGDLADQRNKPPGTVTAKELDDASGRTKTLALVTDVLGGAAIVGAGVSLYLTFKPARTRAAWNVAPMGVSGVSLGGAF